MSCWLGGPLNSSSAGLKRPASKSGPKTQFGLARIRADIEKTIARRCIELGVPVEDKSEPLGRDLLLILNHIMLGMKGRNDQVTAIEFRAAINMTFAAIGRGGECGFSSYNLSHWNTVYNALFLDWQERKTNAQKPMSFFPDAQSWELDVYHSLACYWVLGAGSRHLTSLSNTSIDMLLFPFFCRRLRSSVLAPKCCCVGVMLCTLDGNWTMY